MQNTSEEEYRKKLTPEEYQILRKKGTEKPFSGEYWNYTKDGTYYCKACEHKFDSGCGWPSFDRAFGAVKDSKDPQSAVLFNEDNSHGMKRTEVVCKNCGSHLGHIFNDGPTDTGMRYCINSACLKFSDKKEK